MLYVLYRRRPKTVVYCRKISNTADVEISSGKDIAISNAQENPKEYISQNLYRVPNASSRKNFLRHRVHRSAIENTPVAVLISKHPVH